MPAQLTVDLINKLADKGWRWAIDGPLPDLKQRWKASIEKGQVFYIDWDSDFEKAIVKVAMMVPNWLDT